MNENDLMSLSFSVEDILLNAYGTELKTSDILHV